MFLNLKIKYICFKSFRIIIQFTKKLCLLLKKDNIYMYIVCVLIVYQYVTLMNTYVC